MSCMRYGVLDINHSKIITMLRYAYQVATKHKIIMHTYKNGIIQVVKMVDKGYHLPPPPGLSKELYKTMMQCWYVPIT